MRSYLHQKPIIIKTRIDTENIDVDYLLHIYNYHRLPEDVQEAMISFSVIGEERLETAVIRKGLNFETEYRVKLDLKEEHSPLLLCVGNEDSLDLKYYVSPSGLVRFCESYLNIQMHDGSKHRLSIAASPRVCEYLDDIQMSFIDPASHSGNAALVKLDAAIKNNNVEIRFSPDAIVFICDSEKDISAEDLTDALKLPMHFEQSRQGSVDVFTLTPDYEEGATLEAMQRTVFRRFGTLVVDKKDQKSLSIIESYHSHGRQ